MRRFWRSMFWVAMSFMAYLSLVQPMQEGSVTMVVAMVWVISPGMFGLVSILEGRRLRDVFNPRKQSLAFLIGDTVVLPFMFGALTWEYSHASYTMNVSPIRLLVSFGIGLVAGVLFHANDTRVFTQAGFAREAASNGKIAHDLFIYPALFGAAVCIGVLELTRDWQHTDGGVSLPLIMAISAAIIWLLLGLIDGQRAKEDHLIPWGHVPE